MSMNRSSEYEFYCKKINELTLSKDELILEGKKRFVPGQRYSIIENYCQKKGKHFKTLIEIGCHTGYSLLYVSDRNFAEKLIGIDITISESLQNLQNDRLTFIESNANNRFPLDDKSVDAVVAMMVMEHVFDPFHFCSEISRILTTGGILFLNVPLITAFKHRLALLLGQMPVTSTQKWFEMREWDGGHLHYFTIPLLRNLLELYNIEIVTIKGVGNLEKIKSWYPSLLAAEISMICCKI